MGCVMEEPKFQLIHGFQVGFV